MRNPDARWGRCDVRAVACDKDFVQWSLAMTPHIVEKGSEGSLSDDIYIKSRGVVVQGIVEFLIRLYSSPDTKKSFFLDFEDEKCNVKLYMVNVDLITIADNRTRKQKLSALRFGYMFSKVIFIAEHECEIKIGGQVVKN